MKLYILAPYNQTEAVLRLVLSFSECGSSTTSMLGEGVFPSLLNALHQSDICMHKHSQVLLVYYEVCARYANTISDENLVGKIATNMLGTSGLRHASTQVRHRTSYLFLKFTENLEDKTPYLLNYVGGFSDLILSDIGGRETANTALLNDGAELYLLEAIGIMTSVLCHPPNPALKEQQRSLYSEMISHLRKQVHAICSHPDRNQYEAEFAVVLAHKASSFAALAKGHTTRSQPENVDILLDTANDLAAAINLFANHSAVRARGVIFMHRMIASVGSGILGPVQTILPNLVSAAEAKDTDIVVQLLNQCMIEFTDQILDVIDAAFASIFEKYKVLYSSMEQNYLVAQQSDDTNAGGSYDGPQFDTERISMMKQFLLFVQHIVHYDCQSALTISQRGNMSFIQPLLQIITASLKGKISSEFATQAQWEDVSITSGIPLRKCGVCILTDLVKEWSTGATGIGPSSLARGAVPTELSQAFVSLLFDEFLPCCLVICLHQTSPQSLDLKDAQTLSLVQDVGVLLWTIANVRGAEEITSYLEQYASQSLGWPEDLTSRVVYDLRQGDHLGTFKDNFKKVIKLQMKPK